MKKLENIPKKDIFTVPDGYFDNLPGKIQARITGESARPENRFIFRYKLQYALPLIALMAISIFLFTNRPAETDVDALLASVETEALVAFVNETDLISYDLFDNTELSNSEVQEIENEVYEMELDTEALDAIMEDLDLDNL